MISRIVHYGFSKDTYQNARKHCDLSNQRNTEITVTLFLLVMLMTSIISTLNIIPHAQRFMYYKYFAITALFEFVLLAFRKFALRFNRIFIYLLIVLLVAFSLSLSIEEPFLVSAVFPVFMFLGGVASIDNMARYTLCVIAETTIFTVFSHYNKPPSIAKYDLLYAIIFATITLVFHYRFQKGLIKQFLTYEKTLEIQQDLEVQSSFDALSGLLVRGRFFSLADTVLRGPDRDDYVALCILDLDAFKQINDT